MLPLLVAFLDQSRKEAQCAFSMVLYLCSKTVDVDLAHSNLVARLQGVRRLSNIFYPEVLASKDVGRRAAGMPTNHVEQRLYVMQLKLMFWCLGGKVHSQRRRDNMTNLPATSDSLLCLISCPFAI